jgi:hypothetical protein
MNTLTLALTVANGLHAVVNILLILEKVAPIVAHFFEDLSYKILQERKAKKKVQFSLTQN